MRALALHRRPLSYLLPFAGVPIIFVSCSERVLQTAGDSSEFGGSTGEFGGQNGALIECRDELGQDNVSWAGVLTPEDVPQDSPLLSSTYGALQGPGLYVAARDVFRVYLNGELIGGSDAARTPSFIPLTIPPGDNVLAIAVAAQDGTTALLAHLSELERDYPSNGQWLASTDPGAGWMDPDFDDSSWNTAVELGDFGEVPGCDPVSGFPSGSTARWIGPPVSAGGPVVLRRRFPVLPLGFAAGVTGGDRSEPVVVSTWDELRAAVGADDPTVVLLPEGTHDFRTEPRDQEVCPIACPIDAAVTELHVLVGDEVCDDALVTATRNERRLDIGSNTTIVGLGRGALIRGVSFTLQEVENVIIRNVALYDVNPHLLEAGDAFSLDQPNGAWVDHGTVRWVSDGFTDLRVGADNVTLSYMRYDGEDDMVCGGRHALTSGIPQAKVTLHHNRFDHFRSRAPFIDGADARAHLFNNVFSNGSEWAVGSRCAQVLLEANVFENVEAATSRSNCEDSDQMSLIEAPEGSNLYRDDSNVHLGGDGMEPRDDVFDPHYEYPLETATDAWPRVISRAGTGGPWALPLSRD